MVRSLAQAQQRGAFHDQLGDALHRIPGRGVRAELSEQLVGLVLAPLGNAAVEVALERREVELADPLALRGDAQLRGDARLGRAPEERAREGLEPRARGAAVRGARDERFEPCLLYTSPSPRD